jgi:hypothetical protein
VLTLSEEVLYLMSSSMIQAPIAPAPIRAKLEDIFIREEDERSSRYRSGNEKGVR